MIEVPAGFRAMPRWWQDGYDWLDSLPVRAEQQCRVWDLQLDGPPVHGSNALVLPVRRHGEPLALRLAPPADARTDVEPLQFWAGRGTVLLIAHDLDAGALLLERLDSTRTLRTEPLEPAAEQLGLIMSTLAIPADESIIATTELVTRRLTQLADQNTELGHPVPARILAQAMEAGHSLTAVPATHAVNGDLHHDQILAGTRAPWLCVDARLLRGDRGYDLARCLWTRLDEIADDAMIIDQLVIIADAADLDHDHARRTALYRTVDYWLWGLSVGLTTDPVLCARLVGALVR